MGKIYLIYTAFAAISLFASVLQLYISLKKGKDLIFMISAFYSFILFLFYSFLILFTLPFGFTIQPNLLLKVQLFLGQINVICLISLLYYLFRSIKKMPFLVVNSFIGMIAVITLLMPDSLLFGDQSAIKFVNISPSGKIPMLADGFTVWRLFKDITVITLIVTSFTLLLRKMRDVSFKTIAAIFTGLVLILFAAIYDQLVDLGVFSTVYILPVASFINYFILMFVIFVIFIEDVILKNQMIDQERKCEKLLNEADIIVVELNRMGNVISANPFFYKLTGYSEEQVIGKDWFEFFIPPNETFDVQSAFVEILEYEFHPKYVNPILTRDKKEIMIQWFNVRTHDSQGKISGSLSMGIDISDIEKESGELRLKLSEAEQLAARLSSSPARD